MHIGCIGLLLLKSGSRLFCDLLLSIMRCIFLLDILFASWNPSESKCIWKQRAMVASCDVNKRALSMTKEVYEADNQSPTSYPPGHL